MFAVGRNRTTRSGRCSCRSLPRGRPYLIVCNWPNGVFRLIAEKAGLKLEFHGGNRA